MSSASGDINCKIFVEKQRSLEQPLKLPVESIEKERRIVEEQLFRRVRLFYRNVFFLVHAEVASEMDALADAIVEELEAQLQTVTQGHALKPVGMLQASQIARSRVKHEAWPSVQSLVQVLHWNIEVHFSLICQLGYGEPTGLARRAGLTITSYI